MTKACVPSSLLCRICNLTCASPMWINRKLLLWSACLIIAEVATPTDVAFSEGLMYANEGRSMVFATDRALFIARLSFMKAASKPVGSWILWFAFDSLVILEQDLGERIACKNVAASCSWTSSTPSSQSQPDLDPLETREGQRNNRHTEAIDTHNFYNGKPSHTLPIIGRILPFFAEPASSARKWWEAEKRYLKLRLSTKALKTIKKKGLDVVAKEAGIDLMKK
ncbi:50S ribosomal protein L28 [Nymphaea thermarum]|nr:50S ribosomal protein L28 [Nymphaea thermarum]